MKKLTNDEFLERVPDDFRVLSEYQNGKAKIRIKHLICNHEFEIMPNHFLQRKTCPYCSKKIKWTNERFREYLIQNRIPYKLISGNIENLDSKVTLQYRNLDCTTTSLKNFLNGHGKSKIHISDIKDENFRKRVDELYNGQIKILNKYISNRKPVRVQFQCGHEYSITPENILSGVNCKLCYYDKLKSNTKSTDEFRKDVYKLVGNEYTVLSEYTNSKDLIKFSHNGKHEFLMRPNDFLNGHRCPICMGKGQSKAEDEIYNFLKDYIHIKKHKRWNINNQVYELDLYIPELELGIEYDGLYWHSNLFHDENYHLEKTKAFESIGIDVVHIFEDDWIFENKKIKNRLLFLIGKESLNEELTKYVDLCWKPLYRKKFVLEDIQEIIPPKKWYVENGRRNTSFGKIYIYDCGYEVYL